MEHVLLFNQTTPKVRTKEPNIAVFVKGAGKDLHVMCLTSVGNLQERHAQGMEVAKMMMQQVSHIVNVIQTMLAHYVRDMSLTNALWMQMRRHVAAHLMGSV